MVTDRRMRHMRLKTAAAGSAVFFVVAPCVVAGLVPYWLTGWHLRPMWLPLRLNGTALTLVAAGVLVHAFYRFVMEGTGTPAPVAPPTTLVVGGLYRYVRNPMYLAVIAAVLGQALLLGQFVLVPYAAVVAVAMAAFVHFYEEPDLRERFGQSYEEYCRAVPPWVPRLRPWRG